MFNLKFIKITLHQLCCSSIFVGLLSLPHVGFSQDSEALPTRLEVFQSYLEANGGRSNLSTLQSLVVAGSITPVEGDSQPFKLFRKRPGSVRLQVELGRAVVTTFFDGKRGYQKIEGPNGEPEVRELGEADYKELAESASMEGPFYGLLGRPELIELIEGDELDGVPVYKLTIVKSEHFKYDYVWLSQDHFQEVKFERTIDSPESGAPVLEEIVFSGFSQIEGVYYARESEYYSDGVLSRRVSVEDVRANVGLFDHFFQPN